MERLCSVQSLNCVHQIIKYYYIVEIDTRYQLCFDLFMGTSSITSNLEPCCAEQKMLVDSHRLFNQYLYNSIESNKDPQAYWKRLKTQRF